MSIRPGIFLVTIGLLAASPVSAAIIDFASQGTVVYFHDTAGEFNGVGPGDPFTLVSRADTGLGHLSKGAGGRADGSDVMANITFIQVLTNSVTRQSIESEGGLAATSLVAAPVVAPEPAIWVMLVAGFVIAGGALRRRSDTMKVVAA